MASSKFLSLTRNYFYQSEDFDQMILDQGWTVSSLLENYLKLQIESLSERNEAKSHAPTLQSLAQKLIIEELKSCEDFDSTFKGIVDTLEFPHLVQSLLKDPELTYPLLRACLTRLSDPRFLVDIDEVIFQHEDTLRANLPNSNYSANYLITLEDSISIIKSRCRETELKGDGTNYPRIQTLQINHDSALDGGLKAGTEQETPVEFLASGSDFKVRFDEAGGRCLKGINWDNVLVAGDVALATLLVDNSRQRLPFDVCQPKLYLHGLTSDEAMEKVRHIWDRFSSNAELENDTPYISRTADAFMLMTRKWHMTIVLRLFSSPQEILLHSGTGILVVGYDGKQVLMLPSCARVLEMGFSPRTSAHPDSSSFNAFGTIRRPASFGVTKRDVRGGASEREPMSAIHTVGFWNSSSSVYYWDDILGVLEEENSQGFSILKIVISEMLGHPYFQSSACKYRPLCPCMWLIEQDRGYFTRRIRLNITSTELDDVMRKQVTIPMLIPHQLEETLASVLPEGTLIPVYNSKAHEPNAEIPPVIPRLPGGTAKGNLRYWIIKNDGMWAGHSPVYDVVSGILRLLHHCMMEFEEDDDAEDWVPAFYAAQRPVGCGHKKVILKVAHAIHQYGSVLSEKTSHYE